MKDPADYEAFRAFAKEVIARQVLEATEPLKEEIRSLRSQLETRSAQTIEGPAGKDGRGISRIYIQPDGILAVRYTDSTEEYSVGKVVGEKGDPGKDGATGIGEKGERGADGKDGVPSTIPGPKGDTGERGADGIATREVLDAWFEQRAADLEARSLADVFQGVYDQSKTYMRGYIAVWDGQPWLAMSETRAIPGVSSDWKLLVKKGRDGRDKSK